MQRRGIRDTHENKHKKYLEENPYPENFITWTKKKRKEYSGEWEAKEEAVIGKDLSITYKNPFFPVPKEKFEPECDSDEDIRFYIQEIEPGDRLPIWKEMG